MPTIDQCYTDDHVCIFEANQQFRRDKMVENEILSILRQRFEDCVLYESPDHMVKCKGILMAYEKGAENWFTKCKYINVFLKISDVLLYFYFRGCVLYYTYIYNIIFMLAIKYILHIYGIHHSSVSLYHCV